MYGTAPKICGTFDLVPSEFVYCQYLPIRIPGMGWAVPEHLEWVAPLLHDVSICYSTDHVYLTARHMWCTAESANRPGWHSDGFGTDDINYIWYDANPTEFCVQHFALSDDHELSMLEMERQARPENIVTYPVNTLLRLDQSVIHRVAPNAKPGYRTFVKISVSKSRYNLKGNAHNYLLDYEWEMHDRQDGRNHPFISRSS